MTHSVESRFIAIISGALLVVVAPLFTLFLALSSQQAAQGLNEHVDVLLATNSQALGKPIWDIDVDTVDQIAKTLVADPAIQGVQINDNLGKLAIAEVDAQNPVDFRALRAVSRNISYRSQNRNVEVGSITVYVPEMGWFAALNEMEIAFISIFIVAILTVFGAAVFGNRVMVIKPLLRLTAAIEATRRLGSRHHVDWRSHDEMGRLARSFNEMQTLLEQEERELKRAHRQTIETYNLTPAMLFSLTGDDLVAAVSDYWLLSTGYSREDVIGLPFSDLVAPTCRSLYTQRKVQARSAGKAIDVTVRFICADGRMMDVLIAETELGDGYQKGSLSVMTDVTELKQSEMRNHQQAISDHLTGLLNRQGFEAALDRNISEANRSGTHLACLFVDLDRFKSINDNLGHAAGDAVLCEFVDRIRLLLRPADTASRLGGDEFAVLIAGEDAERRSEELSRKIVDMFDKPFQLHGNSVRLSASIGLAFYPTHAANAAELLQKADMAMYTRKREGKNGAQLYDPAFLDKTRERAEIESDIEAGIAGKWFEAHLQPIIEIGTGTVAGFEALMRMRHPRKGLLPPANIITIAEETGSIGAIGNLILEDAVRNLASISRLPGMGKTYVAVNFSPLQFEPGLPVRLAALLARYNMRPERLVVEITEAVLMHDDPEIRMILNELHDFGCRIALDDFGTGYSSLSYMSRFPVHIVKIDQSFIRSLTERSSDISRKSRMLVEGISAISHKMNCNVVAEGVETEEQRLLLQHMGIDHAQGYLFSKPREIGELLSALSSQTKEIASLAS